MAIRLGNFNENKSMKELQENVAHLVKLETIKKMINKMNEHIQMACDIYDTYYHIKKVDEEFSNKLWGLLVSNKVCNICINSYFAWGIGLRSYVHISKYGVSIYNFSIKETLMKHYNLTEYDLYRGKVLLSDYINKFNVRDEILDKMIEELNTFYVYFEKYANDFFQSVSSYKVVEN